MFGFPAWELFFKLGFYFFVAKAYWFLNQMHVHEGIVFEDKINIDKTEI